jgi:NAD(P)-dependent dehydrogenase (short-subunit alcohol dehydrogenase family)
MPSLTLCATNCMMCRMAKDIAVVTGATSGLGLAVTRELDRTGYRVILAVRDEAKGRRVAATLRDHDHEVRRLDLADLDAVRAFARAVAADHPRLDLLINNAGVMAIPHTLSAQGHEMQFAVNHLAHFALTAQLLASLAAAPAARVVTVTSVLHRRGDLAERRYSPTGAYNRSKLANAVFGLELHRRLTAAGSPVRSVLAHPGYARTNLQTQGPTGLYRLMLTKIGNPLLAVGAEQGAKPILYAATSPTVHGGELIGPGGWNEMRGDPAVVPLSPVARDPAVGRQLWAESERLTGVEFTI